MIVINGKSYSGSSISISNNKVIIDGVDHTPDGKEINITVRGDIESLKVDACKQIKVDGNVNTIKTQSGSVDIEGFVSGNVSTMSGSVSCGNSINGDVSTMSGNIKSKR